MTFRELRRALTAIVLAGLPAGCGLDGDGDPCVDTHFRRFTFTLPADPPLTLRAESCRQDADACLALCELALQRADIWAPPSECVVEFTGDRVTVDVTWREATDDPSCPVPGRRPSGLATAAAAPAPDPAAAWLARAAWFEAASVHAFVQLAAELRDHGAPDGLVRAALRAAADEVNHAALVGGLAVRRGARVPRPDVALSGTRTLLALAADNAAEGCVRETWAAIVAAWQARTATDADVRAAFAILAADELRHAALAWAIDRWLAPRLTAAERATVELARQAAAASLAAPVERDPALAALGLPDRADLRGLVARADALLWSATRSTGAQP